MSWLVGFLVIIAFLWFLFNFPKQTLGCGAVIIGGIILLYVYLDYLPRQERERLESQVDVTIKYDTQACNEQFPLQITISNRSGKTVERVDLIVNVYRPGYSTDISGYDDSYKLDKILAPGESYFSCRRLPPTLEYPRDLAGQLEYKLPNYGKSVSFR
jgi:hypothetical protein